jgi:hypothetical protein
MLMLSFFESRFFGEFEYFFISYIFMFICFSLKERDLRVLGVVSLSMKLLLWNSSPLRVIP